jgi:hypothetical protein
MSELVARMAAEVESEIKAAERAFERAEARYGEYLPLDWGDVGEREPVRRASSRLYGARRAQRRLERGEFASEQIDAELAAAKAKRTHLHEE